MKLAKLNEMCTGDLVVAFSNLSQDITTLDLSNNSIGSKIFSNSQINSGLVFALKYIPSTVTSLDLSNNRLGEMTGEELVALFAAIPKHVTSINLSCNSFFRMSSDELINAFKALPERIISLNLNGNRLCLSNMTADEFSTFIAELPKTLKSLNLGKNNLDHIGQLEYLSVSPFTSNYVTHSKVSDYLSGKALARAISKIPENVTSLDLSDNGLNGFEWGNVLSSDFAKQAVLANIFLAIPINVKAIAVAENKFESTRFSKELIALICMDFYSHMEFIKQKEKKYENSERPDYKRVVNAANTLHTALELAKLNLFNSTESMDIKIPVFKQACLEAIEESREVLEQHRGWKQVLGNLVFAILGLGVGYIAAGLINKAITGNFLFFGKTDSAEKMDSWQKTLDEESPKCSLL